MYESTPPDIDAGLISVILLPLLGLAIFFIACFWIIFKKAGKPGWAAIIPIYNQIVMLEIVGKPVWWIILLLLPIVNIIFSIWVLNLFCKSYGQGVGFTIGVLLLPFIFIPILAFGSSTYIGPAGQPQFKPME